MPAQANIVRADISPRGGHEPSGLPGGLTLVERETGPVILVPSEHVLLIPAELPLPTARGRADALPFAMEERLGAPVETLHFVLGQPLGGERHLGAAITHEHMHGWTGALQAAEGEDWRGLPLVPDVTMLPVPALGWLARRESDRLLVRTDDGGGFAVPVALAETFWQAAGRPPVESLSGDVPAALGARPADLGTLPDAIPLNLRTGPYAARRANSLPWRRLALVASAGLAAHAAILALDTAALSVMADERRLDAERAWVTALPNAALPEDIPASVDLRLAMLESGESGAFLPLLSQMSGALTPLADDVTVSEMRFGEDELVVTLETSDFAGLQAVRTAFADAGLRPVSGTASATPGGAEIAFTLRRGA